MPSGLVSIPKKEFNLLVKCRRIVESEFEERYSEKFIKDVKESEEAYKKGEFVRFESVKDAKEFFDRA